MALRVVTGRSPPIERFPMVPRASGSPIIAWPEVMTNVIPRAIPSMPSVTTKGGTRSLAIMSPLMVPRAVPIATPEQCLL